MTRRYLLLAAASAVAAIGCSSTQDDVVDVYAASSLTDAFSAIESEFEVDHPEIDVRLNLAGSNALQRQILDGAEAHVFAPADMRLLDPLLDDVSDEPMLYARNRLTLVVPAEGDGRISAAADLEGPDILLARCAAGVPCGDAADAYLGRAGLVPTRSTDEPDVRSVLTKVASGEADAGFVYLTDAMSTSAVTTIALDDPPMVSYGLLVLSPDPAAETFAAFVASPEAAAILQELGFTLP